MSQPGVCPWKRIPCTTSPNGIPAANLVSAGGSRYRRSMSSKLRSRSAAGLIALVTAVLAPTAARPADGGKLPPDTLRGLAHLLDQYPTVSLASPAQRTAARQLLARIRATVRPWRDPRAGNAAGFDIDGRRARTSGPVLYFHAEHHRYSHDDSYLDVERPETLVYADVPGRPLVLIGVMFAVPRGRHGPTPGGPITRWHWHRVCAQGKKRGLTPRADGSCPPGTRLRNGSEMMHVWFTGDLRSAFAIHAPRPELCLAGLLPHGRCGHAGHS